MGSSPRYPGLAEPESTDDSWDGGARAATTPVMVVSPHLDDAMLSAWGLLARSPGAMVLNVFCGPPRPAQRTSWDRTCGFADSNEAVATRLMEDRKALSGLPVSREQLGLLEGQYLVGDRSAEDVQILLERLTRWRNEVGEDALIALPAGAGWTGHSIWARASRIRWILPAIAPHPDHLFVRDAVLDVLPALGDARIWLYEELPYRWGGRADRAVYELARDRGLKAHRRELSVARGPKSAACAAYSSQIPHLRGRRWQRLPDDPDGLPGKERYWELTRD